MAGQSVQTLYLAPEEPVMRSKALSGLEYGAKVETLHQVQECPAKCSSILLSSVGPGEVFQYLIRTRKAKQSFKTLHQDRMSEKRSRAFSLSKELAMSLNTYHCD